MPLALIDVKPWDESDSRHGTGKPSEKSIGNIKHSENNVNLKNSWLSGKQRNKNKVTPIFGQHIQPILSIQIIAGILPIHLVDRKWRFKRFSITSLYCLFIYSIVSTLLAFIIRTVHLAYDHLDKFDDKIYIQFVTFLVIPYGLAPFTSWRDADGMAQYLNDWADFQMLYLEVTRSKIVYTRQLFAKMFVSIGIIICGCAFVLCQYLPPYLPIWQAPALPVMVFAGFSVFGYYFSMFSTLSYTGRKFVKSFQNLAIGSSIRSPRQRIRNFERLWLSLSRLANQLGRSSFRNLSLAVGFSVLYTTLCFYQFLASMISEDAHYQMTALYALNTMGNVIPVYAVCNMGYWTTLQIEVKLKKLLWEMNLSDEHADCSEEITSFLRTIQDNPPNISVGGFFNLDRYLLRGTGATVITYLICVVQFRMSATDVVGH